MQGAGGTAPLRSPRPLARTHPFPHLPWGVEDLGWGVFAPEFAMSHLGLSSQILSLWTMIPPPQNFPEPQFSLL